MSCIDGVLFDIDGVIVTSWRPIDGAPGAVSELRERGLRRSFLTNTTSRARGEIAEKLAAAGVEVDIDEIVTAARLTAEYLRANHPKARV
jgi:HAD superfamily hydrolase (TIGR01450 family)